MPERRAATTRRLRRSCATVAVVMAVVVPLGRPGAAGGAATTEVTAAELREMVQAALSDPAVARELRQVDRVDGRPVDVERMLDGAKGADLEGRLRALDHRPSGATPGEPGAPGPASPAEARADARRILEDRRFHPSAVPRPFRGLFRTLGRWLGPLADPVERAWSALFDDALAAGALGAAVAGLATLISVRMIRRRSSAGVERLRRAGRPGRQDDPDDLERRAAEAERNGEFGLAVRLRFRAGLLRLDRAGVVADRPALTTGALTSEVPSPVLRRLAVSFEEVAYGGRTASPDDVAEARAGWRRVLEDVAS